MVRNIFSFVTLVLLSVFMLGLQSASHASATTDVSCSAKFGKVKAQSYGYMVKGSAAGSITVWNDSFAFSGTYKTLTTTDVAGVITGVGTGTGTYTVGLNTTKVKFTFTAVDSGNDTYTISLVLKDKNNAVVYSSGVQSMVDDSGWVELEL